MYLKFDVALQFRDRLYGGLPRQAKMVDQYIEAKFGEENLDLAEKIKAEVDLVEETERVWTGFRTDEKGLYICDYQVKAMLKQCGSLLGIYTQKRGTKNIVKEALFIKPSRLYLDREEPDGTEDIAGHVMTMQGKRSILKRCDYALQPLISFQIWLLDVNKVTGDDLKSILELGQEVGLGSNRSFEAGKFDVTKFEAVAA